MPKRSLRKLSGRVEKLQRTCEFFTSSQDSTSPYFPMQTAVSSSNESNTESDVKVESQSTKEGMDKREVEKVYGMRCLKSNDSVEDSQALETSLISGQRLSQDFYDQDCVTLARALLGKLVVRLVDGVRISGYIVETESYLGGPDIASHSHNGKRTARTEPMYMKPGTTYVYSIYGMYFCFNISSRGDGSCVLIRSLEPLEGFQKMAAGRNQRRRSSTPLKTHELCNGPSKLCQALHLTKDSCNKVDLSKSNNFWLEVGKAVPKNQVIVSKRIGIDSCGEEWANKQLRFYVYDNKHVSVRDKKAESVGLSLSNSPVI